MIRSIAGVVAGLTAAIFVVGVLEAVGHAIYPPPPGYRPSQSGGVEDDHRSDCRSGAIAMVLVAWGTGTFAGAFAACSALQGAAGWCTG